MTQTSKSSKPLSQAVLASLFSADSQEQHVADLYQAAASRSGSALGPLEKRVPIGRAGALHSPAKRRVRWALQSLKAEGLVAKAKERGRWSLTPKGRKHLTQAQPGGPVLVAFSTSLGCALWARCEDVFGNLGEQIHLALTSPPFPLACPRLYGNQPASAYVDWLCEVLEPIVRELAPGGSVVLSLTNDVFERGSPGRSTYLERLVVALEDRLGLSLMDRFVWVNPSRPPGPVQWASLRRTHVHTGWDPVLWFSNDPHLVAADNRRVLEPHTPRQAALIRAGGEARARSSCDGAYRLRPGSFSGQTDGRIPRNVITAGHRCFDQSPARAFAKEHGLAQHGASMPLALASRLVKHLVGPGDLVVDPFAGLNTTARAAELHGARWLTTEAAAEYALSGAQRFQTCAGFTAFGSIQPWDGFEC